MSFLRMFWGLELRSRAQDSGDGMTRLTTNGNRPRVPGVDGCKLTRVKRPLRVAKHARDPAALTVFVSNPQHQPSMLPSVNNPRRWGSTLPLATLSWPPQ